MPSPPSHSGDHKSRLFAWILDVQRSAAQARRPKPFMLLLPAWTSKWLPWRTFLWALARLRKGSLEVAPLIGRVAIPPLPPHPVCPPFLKHLLLQISMDDAAARVKKLANLRDNQLEVAVPAS